MVNTFSNLVHQIKLLNSLFDLKCTIITTKIRFANWMVLYIRRQYVWHPTAVVRNLGIRSLATRVLLFYTCTTYQISLNDTDAWSCFPISPSNFSRMTSWIQNLQFMKWLSYLIACKQQTFTKTQTAGACKHAGINHFDCKCSLNARRLRESHQ